MAVFYWVAKNGGWTGPTGAGTESSPFLGAIAVRNAFGGIIPSATVDDIIFMGEYGPVLLPEIAADWANQVSSIVQVLPSVWPKAGPGASCAGGITFGNAGGSGSNCRNKTFKWRGTLPYHIDARGATINAERMTACLHIQGAGNRSEGLRMAQPNWDWIGSGSGRVPASAIGVGSLLAHESSYENFGLVMYGWGSQIDAGSEIGAGKSTSWGSDAFGRASFRIEFSMLDAPTQSAGTNNYIQNTDSYGMSDGPQLFMNSGQVNGGLFQTRFMPEAGANAYLRWNRVRGLRWGDTLSVPLINNSNMHGNLLNLLNGAWVKGTAQIYGNELSGFCQDSIEVIAQNVMVRDNWIHDICPGFASGATINYWTNTAGAWAQVSNVVLGSGIKCGLGGTGGGNEGQLPGIVWPSLGTVGGDTYRTPAFRNQVFRNLIETNSQDGMPAIATNGSNGVIIHANEIVNYGRGISINRTGSVATDLIAAWVSNNYVQARDVALLGTPYTTTWFYNNIFNGTAIDFNYNGATNHTILGANNRFVNNTTNYGTGIVNLMTGTTTGAANYTVGVGPTVGGNCASAGSWQGITGARTQATFRDKRQKAFTGATPVGPYAP